MTEEKIIELVSRVCELSTDVVADALEETAWPREILRADTSNRIKTRLLFEPLMECFSYQGIGNGIVTGYIEEHGTVSYFQIARKLKGHQKKYLKLCSKLKDFESFKDCGYRKEKFRCNNPRMLSRCPVRTHDLLKGVLNIKAYSFFFYLRDVCQGDLIGRIDGIINRHCRDSGEIDTNQAKDELVNDLKLVFGVGDKLANMTLNYLLCADPENLIWVKVGQAMVAVDSLVHNFLHRTGILRFYQADHPYGQACSRLCNQVLANIIDKIDASSFNPDYPKYFPRFVQFSIWRFCSLNVHNICNGFRIDDSKSCEQEDCPVFSLCDRIVLRENIKERRES